MSKVLNHSHVNLPGFDPDDRRPVRVLLRDLPAHSELPPHSHAWGQVVYAPRGVLRVSADDASWIVPPSRAIWIPPGTVHATSLIEDASLRSMYLLPQATRLPSDACRVFEVTPLLRELIAQLGTEETEADPSREQLVMRLILDELSRARPLPVSVPLPADKRLRGLCEALIADPASELTLADWAARVGASPRTLARLFEQELGTRFTEWRQRMRLAHAAPLIARGYPLSRVADELGYASQSAFSAMFRRSFGQTPSDFFRGLGPEGA